MDSISNDAKAILLLCGHFGGISDLQPLVQSEYNLIVRCLLEKDMRPSDLLQPENAHALASESGIDQTRLDGLLKRGVKLGFAVEQWNRSGIWIICRSDKDYPSRYKTHLKDKAPPILYGTGDKSLLHGGGLAIVGSRNVDEKGGFFTRDVAQWCARGGLPVVSGGARGVDQIAMSSALESGGKVIGVLADSLLRVSVTREARHALSDGSLLLISPYNPEAGFNVGAAMGRNKLIYALADYGLVVSADFKKGGTWEGAQEELQRNPGRPVFVRMAESSQPPGNSALLKLGAIKFPVISASTNPRSLLLQQASTLKPQQATACELPLFEMPSSTVTVMKETNTPVPIKRTPASMLSPSTLPSTNLIYDAVLPVILGVLEKPLPLSELAKQLDVTKVQLEIWLKKALTENKVKKTNRPMRYIKV
jgi:predicted Rossmann fold nucleotide-binding protein DprA/Smf involved in DNA uptake